MVRLSLGGWSAKKKEFHKLELKTQISIRASEARVLFTPIVAKGARPRLVLFFICLSLSACQQGASVIKDCVLPAEQENSLNGSWPVLPVPLAFRQNDWDSTQKSGLQKAATTWNGFYKASKNIPQALEFKPDTNRTPFALCSSNIVPDNEFIDSVVVMKTSSNWPAAQSSVIALTLFCLNFQAQGSGGLAQVFNASMDFNFDDFNNAGQKDPDEQSIMTHELGHLLSMDHSCGPNKPGLIECDNPEASSTFLDAVMFPTVQFNGLVGQVKRVLEENDQGRANCLYEGASGTTE